MLITLAVRHNVSEQELKSLNNIIGEYSLRSRSHIYIPGKADAPLQLRLASTPAAPYCAAAHSPG